MKKMYLLLGAFTFAASAAISQTPLSKEKQTIERPSSISTSSFALGDRAPGDIVLSDDFSDFGNWTTSTLDGTTANWELVATTPPDLVTFM